MSPREFAAADPIYLVPLSELPRADFAINDQWIAYCHPNLDEKLSPILRARDEWKGRGFATIIDDEKLAALCAGDSDGHYRAGLGIAIHEAGHYVANSAFSDVTRAPALMRGHLMQMKSDRDFQSYWTRTPHGDNQHGAVWVRATVHLHHRVNLWEPIDLKLCLMDYPGFPDPNLFRIALGAELDPSWKTPLANLLRQPPPRPFAQFWSELCRR